MKVESKKFQVLLSFFHEYVNTVVIQPKERTKRASGKYFAIKYGMLAVSGLEVSNSFWIVLFRKSFNMH